MKQKVYQFIHRYLNETMDLREQIFHQLLLIGMVLGVLIGISSIITNAGIVSVAVNFATSAAAFAMLEYSSRTEKNKLLYLISVIFVFMIIFPVLFFTSGGYHSGTPSFFVFAIVFTVFILEGKSRYIMVALEIFFYIGICLFAYYYPETVFFFETERDAVFDIVIGFTVTSAALGITVFRYTRIYDNKQRQLSEANATLEQINQMKTEFLANVSHELKTPLTVVSGYAQTSEMQLSGQPENAAVQSKMKLISSEAERLALMGSQVLDVTRIEEGRMVFDPQPCSIDEIIQSAVDTHFPILNKNNNKLKLQIESGLPRVYADPMRLTQVIVNLVANAIRFTSGGVITISARSLDAFVEIAVADTGRGIEPERLPHIFERYNRGESSGDTGTGLGLFICKHIVEGHGGVISIQSETSRGTAFRFTVPVSAQ